MFSNTGNAFGAKPATSTGTGFGFGTSNTNTAGSTGGSLFGQSTQKPSLFGGAGTGTAAGGGGSIFGNTGTGTGGGVFGGGGGTTQPNSLFGNTNANTNATQPAGTGLFGNANTNNATQAPATGLFGNLNANATQPAQAGTGLFGNTNTNTTQPAGTGLFGNTNTNTTQPTGTGLFSNTGQQPTTGSIFGNTNTNTATQPTSLFGNTNTNTQTQQPAAPTSLFGNTNTAGQQQQQGATAPSLFGNLNANANAGAGGTGLFGAQPQQANTNATPSLFGSTTAQGGQTGTGTGLFGGGAGTATGATGGFGAGLFGGSTLQSQPTTILGQPQAPPQGSNLFNLSTAAKPGTTNTNIGGGLGTSMFGQKSVSGVGMGIGGNNLNQPQDASAQFNTLVQRIEGVAQSWDASSPNCRFKHFFYNLVDPNQVHLFVRPANATDDQAWQKACRENPDPTCYVPALAVGFDDLQKRVEAQKQQSVAHIEKIKELKSRLNNLSSSHSVSNTPRLIRATSVQSQINQRLVRLSQHLHLLIPAIRSSSIRPEEERLRTVLEGLEEEVTSTSGGGSGRGGGNSSSSGGRMKSKMNQLWAVIGALEAERERRGALGMGMGGGGGGTGNGNGNMDEDVEWTVVDPEGLRRIAQILNEQQNGLAYLTKLIQRQQADLNIILGKNPEKVDADSFSTPEASHILLGRTNMEGSTLGVSALRR